MRRTGFTLVEIIVVISIIALLMSVTLPAILYARERAKTAVCSSNVRQLSIAFFTYESENGKFPFSLYYNFFDKPPNGWAGDISYDPLGWWWFHYIKVFTGVRYTQKTCLQCPSKSLDDANLQINLLCGNYGVNQYICKSLKGSTIKNESWGTPLSVANIKKASQTVLITDSGYAMINWRHVTGPQPDSLGNDIEDSCYLPGAEINKERTNLWPGQEKDAIKGRHPNNTVNIGFADGHIERKPADTLVVEEKNGSYLNQRPLWIAK